MIFGYPQHRFFAVVGLTAFAVNNLAVLPARASAHTPQSLELHASDAAARCVRLNDVHPKWPDPTTHIQEAAWREDGTQAQISFAPPVNLPQHCEIIALMRERVGIDQQRYAIRFHLRLPRQWNGRFFFQGGGGTNGELGSAVGFIAPGTPVALVQGYAVVSQDSGHDNTVNSRPDRGGTVAFGFDPQARADYGGASLEPVARAARVLIEQFYGRSPRRSYFVGCSKGGQEGMFFAQRYPDLFDGIVAAAPGFSLPRAALAEAWDTQAFSTLVSPGDASSFDPARLPASFTTAQLSQLRQAVLDVCDAEDGLKDGITAAFESCTWRKVDAELQRRTCRTGVECLSEAQIGVLGRVYAGAKDSAGKALYADWPVDAGIGSDAWRFWKIGPANGSFPGVNVAMGAQSLAAVFVTPAVALEANPQSGLDFVRHFDFDRDAPKIYATSATFKRSAWQDISARSPQLGRFRAHGGKLLVPHGVSDPVFSINDTLGWYREVDQLNEGTADRFVRVFPVPGMAHCMGGPTTGEFDAFAALVDWVEHGVAPDRIVAKAGPETPWPGRTRPLCAYPKVARYSGSGSIEAADNFRCE